MTQRQYSLIDNCLIQFDRSLRTLTGSPEAQRPNPAAQLPEAELSSAERRHAAALMRVNHAGEVSAQALYQAQALTARSQSTRKAMQQAAMEENDHLAWCESRIKELDSHTSYLNSFWYLGSFAIGLLAGLAGDAVNLGFVAETERQVVNHLDKHLQQIPAQDAKTQAILTQMRSDEAYHATVAMTEGAIELPDPIKIMMGFMSKLMTMTAYYI